MNWRSIGFDWNRARAFLVTAEEGSFSAAARALGTTQPTVGRQVAGLEEELGLTLFERVGKGLELTASGLELIEHVRAMGAAAMRVSLTATGQAGALEGTVCITASELIATFLLPPILAGLRWKHPGIELEVVASNDVRDLLRREADIAVRNVAPTHPELVARSLGTRYARPYAT
ncbi:MAG: LysR family transcriptional regulator, partial [Nannocystaceae bacterium]